MPHKKGESNQNKITPQKAKKLVKLFEKIGFVVSG